MKINDDTSEVMDAIKKRATGYDVTETTIEKSPNGQARARQKKKYIPADPMAAKAYLQLQKQIDNENDVPNPKLNWFEISTDERLLIRSNKVCEIMKISDKTLHVWAAKGAPKEKRGWWDISALIQWRGMAMGVQGGPTAEADKLQADTRLKQARAAIAEMDLKQKEGDMVSLFLVEERLIEVFSTIRQSMLSIGDKLMAEIYTQYPELAAQAKEMINLYVREALREIATTGKFTSPLRRLPNRKTVGRPRSNN